MCALAALSTQLFTGALDDSSRGRWTAYALGIVVAGRPSRPRRARRTYGR
ncbi:hypothetical protein ABZS81_11735 [Streptomyces sp. NPDC005318]